MSSSEGNNKQKFLADEEKLENNGLKVLETPHSEQSDPPIFRSYWQRTFGPMADGSLRSSIFTLANMTMGTGCLALPQVLYRLGFVQGCITIIIMAFLSYIALFSLAAMSQKYNIYEYSSLMEKIHGRAISLLGDVFILLYIFMSLISYLVISNRLNIVNKLTGIIIFDFFYFKTFEYIDSTDFLEHSYWNQLKWKAICNFGYAIFLLTPLCLIRDFSKMGKVSLIGVIALTYTVIVILAEFPFYLDFNKTQNPPREVNWTDWSESFKADLLFFPSVANVFFAFSNAIGSVPVYKSLHNKTERRIDKMFKRAIFLTLVIYLIIAIFGYLSVPVDTPELIIFRPSIFKSDWVMSLGKIGIVFSIMFSFPPFFSMFKFTFFKVFFGRFQFSDLENYLMTGVILALFATFGTVFDEVSAYIGLIGGFLSVIICFILPISVYIRGNDSSISSSRNLLLTALCVVIFIFGYSAGIILIVNQFRKEPVVHLYKLCH